MKPHTQRDTLLEDAIFNNTHNRVFFPQSFRATGTESYSGKRHGIADDQHQPPHKQPDETVTQVLTLLKVVNKQPARDVEIMTNIPWSPKVHTRSPLLCQIDNDGKGE